MGRKPLHTYNQKDRGTSPRTLKELVLSQLWEYVWFWLCEWTPKPFNQWRVFWLRLFGSKIHGPVSVHPRARIECPWNLTMHAGSSLGDRTHAYCLGEVELGRASCVSQEAYLCTGTHKFENPELLPLQVAKITIGELSFIGARSFLLPGVTVGTGSIVAACSVVTSDVEPWMIAAGNPCKIVKPRKVDYAPDGESKIDYNPQD